jgi:hypothetical protein
MEATLVPKGGLRDEGSEEARIMTGKRARQALEEEQK